VIDHLLVSLLVVRVLVVIDNAEHHHSYMNDPIGGEHHLHYGREVLGEPITM
jgi:hypothetical protein